MSLDVSLIAVARTNVFDYNITHNLTAMAEEAGIYKHLWRPEEIGIKKAEDLVVPLKEGLALLKSNPKRFKEFNPKNGWGDYNSLVSFVEIYLEHCISWPDAEIHVNR